MLKEISELVWQKFYSWISDLNEIIVLGIDTPQERFDLMLSILKLSDSLKLSLVDRDTLWELWKIQWFISNAMSNMTNNKLVWFFLSQVIFNLSAEFNNKINLEQVKKYINKKVDFSSVFEIPKEENIYTKLWSFKWSDGKQYDWEWIKWLLPLKQLDVVNILKWYPKGKNQEIDKTIEAYLNKDNEALIKKEFVNMRNAWISLLKYIIWVSTSENSKIIKLFNT